MVNPTHLAKLRWRSRRGMLELDLMLQKFFDKKIDTLSEAQLLTFEMFLESPDPDIYAWLMGYETCDQTAFVEIIQLIQDVHKIKTF